ncbi:SH3 domain-containing protein [Streptomyces sp. NPDC127068]|uniref:SH3 domain-containing protein n=1 Tax=Streptomyces sp. NPDC127068 TaxID=3347127 RepID=UPI00366780DA
MSEKITTLGAGPDQVGGDTVAAQAARATTYLVVATVNARSGPGLSYPVVVQIAGGTRVSITCQKRGTTITGPLGTTNIWDKIGNGRYVSDAYVQTGNDGFVRPECP